MTEENRISKEPLAPPPRPDEPDLPLLAQRRAPIWTPAQLAFLVAQFATLFAAFILLRMVNYYYVQYLWTHPMGLKMTIMAIALMTINVPLFLGLTFLLNQMLLRGEGRRKTHIVLMVLLYIMFFILFFLPALFVLLVGPACIQIMDSMTPPKL